VWGAGHYQCGEEVKSRRALGKRPRLSTAIFFSSTEKRGCGEAGQKTVFQAPIKIKKKQHRYVGRSNRNNQKAQKKNVLRSPHPNMPLCTPADRVSTTSCACSPLYHAVHGISHSHHLRFVRRIRATDAISQLNNHPIFLNPQKRSECVAHECIAPPRSFGEGSKNECVTPQGSLGADSEDRGDEQSRAIGAEKL